MTASIPSTKVGTWTVRYDETLQQQYYYNSEDDSISFDSPCEVSYMPESVKQARGQKKSILSKIGTMFLKSSKSNEETSICPFATVSNANNKPEYEEREVTTEKIRSQQDSQDDSASVSTRIDDEYLLTNPANFRNFAGTSFNAYYDSDMESISSSESIQSYYSELNSYYYESDGDYEAVNSLFDKEEERRELRLQIMQEMEI